MSSHETVRLSAIERQFLRHAVRTHPEVLGEVRKLSDISALDKRSLIQVAEALDINVAAAKSGAPVYHLPRWDSVEGREQQRQSDEKLPFVGSIEEPMTFLFAGGSTIRTLRVSYELTPEWPYIDLETCSEVLRTGQTDLTYELSVRQAATSITSRGQGKTQRRSSTPTWVNCTELAYEGVFGRAFENAVTERIEEVCLRENQMRRAALARATKD